MVFLWPWDCSIGLLKQTDARFSGPGTCLSHSFSLVNSCSSVWFFIGLLQGMSRVPQDLRMSTFLVMVLFPVLVAFNCCIWQCLQDRVTFMVDRSCVWPLAWNHVNSVAFQHFRWCSFYYSMDYKFEKRLKSGTMSGPQRNVTWSSRAKNKALGSSTRLTNKSVNLLCILRFAVRNVENVRSS
jgi:hypothetical protein